MNHTLETRMIIRNVYLHHYNCKVTYPLSTIRFFLHNETAMIDRFMSLEGLPTTLHFLRINGDTRNEKPAWKFECEAFSERNRIAPCSSLNNGTSQLFPPRSLITRSRGVFSSLSSKTVLRLIETHGKEFCCLFLVPRFRN